MDVLNIDIDIIRSHLRRPLAKKIISGEIQNGDTISVLIENNEVKWIKGEITTIKN